MKKHLPTLGLTMLFSTFIFAQTWEEIDVENGDFSVPEEAVGVQSIALDPGILPGWEADGVNGKISRTDFFTMAIGFDGNGAGDEFLYNIIDSKYEANNLYKLSFKGMTTWLAKVDSAHLAGYLSYFDTDETERTKLDSVRYTLLPGKDEEFKDFELIIDMADHADAIDKNIVIEFGVSASAFKDGEIVPTQASWCNVDDVFLDKATTSTSILNPSNLGAKFFINKQQITIKFSAFTQGNINIYTVGGSLVLTDKVNDSVYTRQLNLEKGIYIIKMDTPLESKVTKFCIQ